MKYLAVFALILFSACLSHQQSGSALKNTSSDIINVNGSNETVPAVTDINILPPEPLTISTVSPTTSTSTPITKPTTTKKPITTSTTSKTTTSTTTTVAPITTVHPNVTTTVTPNVTTTVTPNVTTTVTPDVTTTSKPINPTTAIPEPHRRFDGPSFVGGIVLALGLAAIGFVAFKFYKARTEQNYHTL